MDDCEHYEALYRQEMARFILPSSVVATRTLRDSASKTGPNRCIHDEHWLINIGKDTEIQKNTFWIYFDPVVAEGNVRLNAPQHRPDYAVKKVMILTGLSGTHGVSYQSSDHCQQMSRHFDWFVRWRLGLGKASNSSLTMGHFEEDYVARLKQGNVLAFVPLEARLDTLLEKLKSGEVEARDLLNADHSDPQRRSTLDWRALAGHLGVTSLPLSRSLEFKRILIDGLAQIDDDFARIIAQSIRPAQNDTPTEFAPQTVRHILRTWQTIYRLGTVGAVTWNTLSFDPFRKRSVRKYASEITTRVPTRTKTILPDDFLRLTRAATRWVVHNHEYIELAVTMLRQAGKIESAYQDRRAALQDIIDARRPEGSPLLYFGWAMPSRGKYATERERISVGYAAKLLMSASMLAIGCFSPRRGAEIGQLRVGCIEETPSGPLLHAFIEKTFRGVRGVPVPLSVKYVVGVVERLDHRTTEDPESQWLFKVKKSVGYIESKVSENIDEFVRFLALEPPHGASEWNLASHQLRRGHAIFFHYGNEWSDIDDVAYSLMHLDVGMTHIYLSEIVPGEISRLSDELTARSAVAKDNRPQEYLEWEKDTRERLQALVEFSQEFEEVRLEAYVYKAMQLYSGDDAAIGGYARTLYKQVETIADLAKRDARVASRGNDPGIFLDAFAQRLRKHAATHYLQPTPGGAAHCAARPQVKEDLDVAECLKKSREVPAGISPEGPHRRDYVDHRFSGALPCLNCSLCLALKSNQRVLDRKEEALADAVKRAPTAGSRADRNRVYLEYRDRLLRAKTEKVRG